MRNHKPTASDLLREAAELLDIGPPTTDLQELIAELKEIKIRLSALEAGRSIPKLAYSVDDVVLATSLGKVSIFANLKSGDLKSIKVGRRRLIPAAALAEFLMPFANSRSCQ